MNKLVLFFVSFSIFAATGFGQISSVTNDEFEAKVQQAVAMLQQGKHAEAQKLCEEASVLRPTDGRSYGIAGLSHLQQWKLDEASTLLGKAVTLSPNHPYFHYYKASADRFRNQRADGLISVRKAIELKPDFADAYLLLGDLLTDPAEREAAFRKAISLDPRQLQAYRSLGSQLEGKHKDLKAAEEVYRTAIEVDPDKMAGRFDLGRLLVKQGRLAEARVLWNERKADKDNTFPNFITVLERAEKFQSVKKMYDASPNDVEAILAMGYATMDGDSWVVDGRQDKAIVFFRKALKIKPDFAKAQHAICKAYVQIADTFRSKNPELDAELATLRKMDEALAEDIVAYRKSYSGGLKAAGPPPPAAKKP